MIFKQIFLFLLVLIFFQVCVAPPVTQNKQKEEQKETDSDIGGLEDYMEYGRYLKEVVHALEADPEFRKKLENADENDIKSGKIADELEFVSHHIRNRLDEIKRIELTRLQELTEKKLQLTGNQVDLEDPAHGHLDHLNPHTFEIEDLKKLIAKTTADLADADRKRREEFKKYELEKEYEKQQKLNHTNGSEREKLEKQLKEAEEKHKKHEKLHEPGHKAQLQEVWEGQDQMQQEFNPKTFFMLHDVDGNGLWDQNEVKALFVKELEKMYSEGHPEDDMRERMEEMDRMRERVFEEVDLNKDGYIDYEEFYRQTKTNDFQQDRGWQGLDERKPYTDEELQDYIRQHQEYQQHQYEAYQHQQQQQQQQHYQKQYHQEQMQQQAIHANQPPQYHNYPQQEQYQQPPQQMHYNQQPQHVNIKNPSLHQQQFQQNQPSQQQFQQNQPPQQQQFQQNQLPQQHQQFQQNQPSQQGLPQQQLNLQQVHSQSQQQGNHQQSLPENILLEPQQPQQHQQQKEPILTNQHQPLQQKPINQNQGSPQVNQINT